MSEYTGSGLLSTLRGEQETKARQKIMIAMFIMDKLVKE
jgi:hypothetical protein